MTDAAPQVLLEKTNTQVDQVVEAKKSAQKSIKKVVEEVTVDPIDKENAGAQTVVEEKAESVKEVVEEVKTVEETPVVEAEVTPVEETTVVEAETEELLEKRECPEEVVAETTEAEVEKKVHTEEN
jgi:hypothetical protein